MSDQINSIKPNEPEEPVINEEQSTASTTEHTSDEGSVNVNVDAHLGRVNVVVKKEKKHKHDDRAFFPILLILVGGILLVQNLGLGLRNFNWWALFIFLPVAGALSSAWGDFRCSRKLDGKVRSNLGSALLIGTVAVLLLAGADWSHWWPSVLMAAGISSLLGGIDYWDPAEHKNLAAWSGFNAWVGLGVLLLGAGFLVKFLPIATLSGILEGWRWWAVPILVAAFGAFVSAAVVCWHNDWQMNWSSWGFIVIGVVVAVVGLFALVNLSWSLLAPVVLIGVGLVVLSRIVIKK